MAFFTVTVHVVEIFEFFPVIVIVVEPNATPVTVPSSETVAILSLADVYVRSSFAIVDSFFMLILDFFPFATVTLSASIPVKFIVLYDDSKSETFITYPSSVVTVLSFPEPFTVPKFFSILSISLSVSFSPLPFFASSFCISLCIFSAIPAFSACCLTVLLLAIILFSPSKLLSVIPANTINTPIVITNATSVIPFSLPFDFTIFLTTILFLSEIF